MKDEHKRYFAEMVGTFALVFIGAGAVMANIIAGGALGTVGIALAHGFVLMAMIYALGNTSGGHFNPAVTIAFVFARKMKPSTGWMYILFQLLGSLLAAFALMAVFPGGVLGILDTQLGAPALNTGLGVTRVIGTLIETVLTFFLVFTALAVALDKRNSTPMIGFAIGMALAIGVLVGGPFTGGALNPARAFGPMMVTEVFASGFVDPAFWFTFFVYWVGPVAGGLAAAIIYFDAFLPGERKRARKK